MKERKDIQKFYSAFDLNLSTSTFGESFPNVLIEGMSCCIPTLASKISDNHKILNDKNMIFEANNDVELVKKIKGILKKYNNQKYKQQNYNLRKRVIDNFSLNLMCKNYHLFFKVFVC